MKLADIEEYKKQDWYKHHTKRWDILRYCGWIFRGVFPKKGLTGIRMIRRGDCKEQTFYVSKSLDFRKVHTYLLESCEQFVWENIQ